MRQTRGSVCNRWVWKIYRHEMVIRRNDWIRLGNELRTLDSMHITTRQSNRADGTVMKSWRYEKSR